MRMTGIIAAAVLTVFVSVPAPAAAGLNLEYSSYLGGADEDIAYALALDDEGNIFLCGRTLSSDFPTLDPYQPESPPGTFDIFVTAFFSTGSALLFSTYLGGSGPDEGWGIAIDEENRPVLTGWTYSDDFPTCKSVQGGRAGDYDAVAARLSSTGSALVFSTYLGGGSNEYGYGIDLKSSGEIFLTGSTLSADFPTSRAYQPGVAGLSDAFLTCLDSPGHPIIFSTYLGGSGGDYCRAVTVDGKDRILLAGYTSSADFPTLNPYQSSASGPPTSYFSAFLTALKSSGSTLIYSTYLGGSEHERAYALAVDSQNRAWISGYSRSLDFPTVNPYQPSRGAAGADAFATGFTSSGSSLVYSTYLGGDDTDEGNGIVLDDNGTVYLAGKTVSFNFPTVNSFQNSMAGGAYDVFLTALRPGVSDPIFSTYLGGSGSDSGRAIGREGETRFWLAGTTDSADFPTADPYQAAAAGDQDAFLARFRFVTPTPSPTPSRSPSPVATSTPSPSPTATVSPVPTATPSPSATPATSPTPTPTPMRRTWRYDYDGDGTSDIALFRPSTGLWAVRDLTRVYFGSSIDETAPGDYDGNGITEIALFRPSSGLWAVRGITRIYFGKAADWIYPGDYDGDGTGRPAVFRPSTGLWAVRGLTRVYFGGSADRPVSAYFTPASSLDIAVFRPATGLWAFRGISRFYYGILSDQARPDDYNGNLIFEAAVYRPAIGLWAIRGLTRIYFGGSADLPVPGDYLGDGAAAPAVFRESSGLWAIRGITRLYFGRTGDLPAAR